MTKGKTAVIVLAAGMGTRMKSARPKVTHLLAGRPMIAHLMETVGKLKPHKVVVVTGPGMEAVAETVAPHPTVIQKQRRGTGHAVKTALPALGNFKGDVLVLFGDSPLLSAKTMKKLVNKRRAQHDTAVALLGFSPTEPGDYGRIIVSPGGGPGGGSGGVEAIVEIKDATPDQKRVKLCNAGAMVLDGKRLARLVDKIGKDNAKGEYYLTDVVGLARKQGWRSDVLELKGAGAEAELAGINSRAQLADVEAILQDRLRSAAMDGGATLLDPKSVYFSYDAKIGRDVSIGPNVFFGPGVTVKDNVEIRPFCHIEGAEIGENAVIGPFARLRPGAKIGHGAHVGNYVEIKNATIEPGAKVNHLSYIGDARVGEGANIGAGTITCNYDGFTKSHTHIGAGAFIGSNTALVAPVTVGDGAIVGAGSVIAKDVPPDSLDMTRAKHSHVEDGAKAFRRRKSPEIMKHKKKKSKNKG